jgi:alkanesulfonate monooxygenase SsuD/methylene tetrahydromethanopterin reductase-like flavin-dependent oxidoreductase (luciferase family)
MLAACAGATSRIRLMASLIVGPARETTLFARQAATVDAISGGRLTLGLGVGARADDYEATGLAFAGRGPRAAAQLATLRRLWRGEALDEGIGSIGVAPARVGGPEVLIGGYVDAIAGRIAEHGDGYMAPGGGDPIAVAALWQTIRAVWTAAGRAGVPRFVGSSYFALGRNAASAAAGYIEAYYGYDPVLAARRLATLPTTPEAVRATIRRAAELGCDELVLRPVEADPAMIDHLASLVTNG